MKRFYTFLASLLLIVSCSDTNSSTYTEADALEFLERIEKEDETLGPIASSAYWIGSNFITYDSQKIVSDFGMRLQLLSLERAREAALFNNSELSDSTRRKLDLIKGSFVMPSPYDSELAKELSNISTELEAMYGTGSHCFEDGECYDLEAFENVIDNSRDTDDLLRAWTGWREIGKPMKEKYLRMVEIGNQGAEDLGYSGLLDLWFSKYDMPVEEFQNETERVWQELKPLYDSLQCHVKNKLTEYYGPEIMPGDGTIPAHILGNMWGQSWINIYDLVYEPAGEQSAIDLTAIINERNLDEIEMVEIAENFFLSLGFDELSDTFWDRSLFVKPQDRDVVCHASAWNLDSNEDLRIKMCIEKNSEDFTTIHHELGHIFYYQAYNHLPSVFEGGANDGFHEAVGDLLALSITPDYLERIGFISKEEADAANSDPIALLMQQALDGVVGVPWTLMLDRWRGGVFEGTTSNQELNSSWWSLRKEYQGITSPAQRPLDAFDPGAKYHIPGNTPYTRYYLARIMQYQFHEALCKKIGFQGPLHECSIYNSKIAGESLRDMLSLGQSVPWQDAFEKITGTRSLSGTSMLNYYMPLKEWLDDQNDGLECGWE